MRRIGAVIRTHGRNGELLVACDAVIPKVGESYQLVDSQGRNQGFCKLQQARPHQGRWIVKFNGCHWLDQAKRYLQCGLLAAGPKLPEGTHWVEDLVGCAVVTDQGEHLGHLKEVLRTPANDLYVVSAGKKEFYLPALKSVVKEVDLPQARLTVHLLPGMRETFL